MSQEVDLGKRRLTTGLLVGGTLLVAGMVSAEWLISNAEEERKQTPEKKCLLAVARRLTSNDAIIYDYNQKGENKSRVGRGAFIIIEKGAEVETMELDLLKDMNWVIVNHFDLNKKKASTIEFDQPGLIVAQQEHSASSEWRNITGKLNITAGLQYRPYIGDDMRTSEVTRQTRLIATAPIATTRMQQGYRHLNALWCIQEVKESGKREQYIQEFQTFMNDITSQLPLNTSTAKPA